MDSDLRTARFMWIAFMMGAVTLLLVTVRIESQGIDRIVDLDGVALWTMRAALAVLSLAGLAASRIVQRSLAEQSRRPDTTPSASPLTVMWMNMAFGEAIAVYGLLLYLLGGQIVDVAAFVSVSLVVLAWMFPRHSNWPSGADEQRSAAA